MLAERDPLSVKVPELTDTELPESVPAEIVMLLVAALVSVNVPPAVVFPVRERLPALAVSDAAPAEAEMVPVTRLPVPGEIETAVPLASVVPTSEPAPETLTELLVLLKLSCPSDPVAELAEMVPTSDIVPAAFAELVIDTDPPVPAPGASALMFPVTPLFVTVEPTIKGLAESL